MEKTKNNHLLPAGIGPERAPISKESEGPVPAGKKTSPGVPAGDCRDPEVSERPVRRPFSAEYKLQILRQADACTEPGQLGELLRREGLYASHLSTWRRGRERGTLDALAPKKRGRKPRDNDPLIEENHRLERVNKRLVERLRQAEVIIDVQKKLPRSWAFPCRVPSQENTTHECRHPASQRSRHDLGLRGDRRRAGHVLPSSPSRGSSLPGEAAAHAVTSPLG